jgi:hypothetical protein
MVVSALQAGSPAGRINLAGPSERDCSKSPDEAGV